VLISLFLGVGGIAWWHTDNVDYLVAGIGYSILVVVVVGVSRMLPKAQG
jgi:hypothetical protein